MEGTISKGSWCILQRKAYLPIFPRITTPVHLALVDLPGHHFQIDKAKNMCWIQLAVHDAEEAVN